MEPDHLKSRRELELFTQSQAAPELQQEIKRVSLLAMMCDRIRQSLQLEEMLETTVAEVRQFLDCDRAIVYRLQSDKSTVAITESVGQDWLPITTNNYWKELCTKMCQPGNTCVADIHAANLNQTQLKLLTQFQIRAFLIVPIPIEPQTSTSSAQIPNQLPKLWGFLIAHQCSAARQWQVFEIDLLTSFVSQLGVAILQAQLYQQVRDTNTDLKRQVEERTVNLEQKIQQLQDLHTLKDDFLSTVSHELRTPLANMKMAIQMLKIAPKSGHSKRYLEILQAECNREADLINDLLDLQRLEAESYPMSLREALNLSEWLPKVVEPFYARFQERQQIFKVEITPVPPLISSSNGLGRILAELLNNACKYTQAGKKIVLRASYRRNPEAGLLTKISSLPHLPAQRQPTNIAANIKDGFIIFTIANQAEIQAKELSRIFDKFYRVPYADPWRQGGTGLGLALVKKLVYQLDGTIWVESGSGWTTFSVKFPLRKE